MPAKVYPILLFVDPKHAQQSCYHVTQETLTPPVVAVEVGIVAVHGAAEQMRILIRPIAVSS